MNSVNGKVIVVTGGGQGLGAAISRTLAQDGAIVIPVDIKAEKLEKIVNEINGNEGKAEGFGMNVADEKNVQEVIQKIIDKYGKIDVVINNAGVDHTYSIEDLTHDQWHQVIDVNLTG